MILLSSIIPAVFSAVMTCYLIKKCISINYLTYMLTRVQPVFYIQRCGYANNIDINLSDGPVSTLKKKITRGELMNDAHQMKVVQILQKIYEDVYNYKPQQLNLLEKWFGSRKKDVPKGLYIHGAVGGGKTMLMDLFYNCCQVSFRLLFS